MYKNIGLLTDFYELTMMQGYYLYERDTQAVFDMYFRRLPFGGAYVLFTGLDTLLDALENLRFTEQDISYLKGLNYFRDDFLDFLADFQFNGSVYSIPEGTPVFPNEPLIRVHGTIIEAQLIESMLLNIINFQSLIATKTSRIVYAARNGSVLEFGLRRAQGIDGAMSAARAAYIGGAAATSNTLAGKSFGIPAKGTMAHSWIMSFGSELEAFEKYAELYPENCILLVDTYDTLKSGIPNAIQVIGKLKENGSRGYGIRLDSGDILALSREARNMLDTAGLNDAVIVVSNEMDEYRIKDLLDKSAPIDIWGVGTRLVTAEGDPALSGVYKIAAKSSGHGYEPCMKLTNEPGKLSNPGIKNILRLYGEDNEYVADVIYEEGAEQDLLNALAESKSVERYIEHNKNTKLHYASYQILLKPVMKQGKRIKEPDLPKHLSEVAKKELSKLPKEYTSLKPEKNYPVLISKNLSVTRTRLIEKLK